MYQHFEWACIFVGFEPSLQTADVTWYFNMLKVYFLTLWSQQQPPLITFHGNIMSVHHIEWCFEMATETKTVKPELDIDHSVVGAQSTRINDLRWSRPPNHVVLIFLVACSHVLLLCMRRKHNGSLWPSRQAKHTRKIGQFAMWMTRGTQRQQPYSICYNTRLLLHRGAKISLSEPGWGLTESSCVQILLRVHCCCTNHSCPSCTTRKRVSLWPMSVSPISRHPF